MATIKLNNGTKKNSVLGQLVRVDPNNPKNFIAIDLNTIDVIGTVAEIRQPGNPTTIDLINSNSSLEGEVIGLISDFNALLLEILERHSAMQDPTGFENRTDSSWTFTDGSRKLIITTVNGYNVWFDGVKHRITTTKEIEITDVEGIHLIYFDSDDIIKEYVNPTTANILSAIRDKCLIAYVYWDATNNVGVYVGEERHGCVMDGVTHFYLHFTRGLQLVDGLGLGDFVIGDGSLDTHAQFSVAQGSVSDEDIGITVNAIASNVGLPILYLDGANAYWRTVTQAGFSCYQNPAGTTHRLMYNQLTGGSWQRTEVGEGNYVLYHVFATTGKVKQMYSIMGQATYTTIVAARAGAQTEIAALVIGNLPSVEMRPIGTVIFQTDKDYANSIKARVIEVDGVGTDDYVDWRVTELPRGVPPADHGSLTGLADDDHTAYWREGTTRSGNFATTGYVQGRKSGVYAYLSAPNDTTIVAAGTYYPISGPFTNDVIEDFTLVATPAIRYDGSQTQFFKIDWHAAVQSDRNGTTVHCAIYKGVTQLTGSIMCTFCKTAGETYNLSGTVIVQLATNDEIQLTVTSDGPGDVITFEHYTTSIGEFFD